LQNAADPTRVRHRTPRSDCVTAASEEAGVNPDRKFLRMIFRTYPFDKGANSAASKTFVCGP